MHDSNFKVFVRCRTKDPGAPLAYDVAPPADLVRKGAGKRYSFDRVFGAQQDQAAVFDACALPLVDEFLRGYNGTMFAYGQTGTGKTYTMTGDCKSPDSPAAGIVPRVLQSVFSKLEESQREEWSLELRYVELYNEELRDLLDPSPPTVKPRGFKQLRIAENQLTHSTEVFGATSHAVTSCASALAVIRGAQTRRQTAATALNSDSSRSHTVLTLVLVVREPVSGMAVRSKLHLVDLAGSESVAKSGALRQRAVEAGEINKSLLALGRVIEALVDAEKAPNSKPRYVSYRASKLTQLLQDSLGGATKTSMVATVSIAAQDADETRSTLDYALRARSIKNQQQTEVELLDTLPTIKEMSRRLEEVQRELTAQRIRDGCVCITTARYEQLAAGEQKAAKVLAQHETTTRHERAQLEHVQQENARLEAQLAALTAEHRGCSNAAITHTRLQQAVTNLSHASHKHAVLTTETCESLFAKLGELPAKLAASVAELRDTLQSQAWGSSAPLQAQCAEGIHEAVRARSAECTDLVSSVLQTAEAQLTATLTNLMDAWQKSAQELHRPLKDATTLTAHLADQIENIQERVAQEQAANAEAVALARDLMAREHAHAQVLKQLQEAAQDRQALTRRLIDSGKASNTQLPVLSARTTSAGECLANIEDVLKRPAPSPPADVHAPTSAQFGELASQIPKALAAQFGELESEVAARVDKAVVQYGEQVHAPERQRLKETTRGLAGLQTSIRQAVSQFKPDVTGLAARNADIALDMAKFQQQARSVPPTPQRSALASARSPARSPTRSPTRSPARSPTRSPHKFSAGQASQGSPRKVKSALASVETRPRPGSGPTQRVLALGRPPSNEGRPGVLRDIGNQVNVQLLRMSDKPTLTPSQQNTEASRSSLSSGRSRPATRGPLDLAARRSPRRGGTPLQKRARRGD